MPVAGLLGDGATLGKNRCLTLNLVAHSALDRAKRVDVLGLGASAELFGTVETQRNVRVTADVTALHASIGDVESLYDFTNGSNVCSGEFWSLRASAVDRLGDNLNQWNTGTVVVDQRILRTLDATGCATNVG